MQTVVSGVGKFVRAVGQGIDKAGKLFEIHPHEDKLIPSTRIIKFQSKTPEVNASFVAQSATILGNVKIGLKSSIWYGAVIRGDINAITIGDNVSIGDRVLVHVSGSKMNKPTQIGNNVVVEAGAILHGCTLQDNTMVGAGSQIMDGAVLQKNSIVAPGSVVSPGKVILSGQLWQGIPAVFVRKLSDGEVDAIAIKATENAELASVHATESAKSWQMIEEDEYNHEQEKHRNPEYFQRLTPDQISHKQGEVEYHRVPGRIFDSNIAAKAAD